MDKVTLKAIIDEGTAAFKASGSGNGAKVTLFIPEAEMGNAIRLLLLRKIVLDCTLEPEDDYSD